MIRVEAPAALEPWMFENPSIFLAGGITDCPDWQSQVLVMLAGDSSLTVFNPRRADFPMGDHPAGIEQIRWENAALHAVDVVLFWFPGQGAVQPIALFELGYQLRWLLDGGTRRGKIVVGCEPGYPRELDVREQVRLATDGRLVVESDLETVVGRAVRLAREVHGGE